jgi:esterase/lipase superfamily enzyme
MPIEYRKWFSSMLGQDIELKVYGYYGQPVLIFPSQQGAFAILKIGE